MRRPLAIASLLLASASAASPGGEFPTFKGQQIDPRVGEVCYAVATADVDGELRGVLPSDRPVLGQRRRSDPRHLHRAPDALDLLFTGGNTGKVIVHL